MFYVYNRGYVGGRMRRTLDLMDYQSADLVGIFSIPLGDIEAQSEGDAIIYWIPNEKALEYITERLHINA